MDHVFSRPSIRFGIGKDNTSIPPQSLADAPGFLGMRLRNMSPLPDPQGFIPTGQKLAATLQVMIGMPSERGLTYATLISAKNGTWLGSIPA